MSLSIYDVTLTASELTELRELRDVFANWVKAKDLRLKRTLYALTTGMTAHELEKWVKQANLDALTAQAVLFGKIEAAKLVVIYRFFGSERNVDTILALLCGRWEQPKPGSLPTTTWLKEAHELHETRAEALKAAIAGFEDFQQWSYEAA